MQEKLNIAGYCRISVDEEEDRENTSIENQKSIIKDFVARKFPDATLDFYEDRDRSGYTFEQREGYQKLRPKLLDLTYDILIVKDFSRFSRRNSKGLVELEDLRDGGTRIIAIGDSIDYPTFDDWTAIQFRFLINEMPVTDTSKKVKSVIKRRQAEGKWICSVPYGYVITNSKTMTFEIDESSATVVREIFTLYNEGYGYKKIANHLTDKHIPTPRMTEKMRKEANGEEYKAKVREQWSIVTVSEILSNDFYIGTLRQGKYKRKKINGSDVKLDAIDHIVFENNHPPIIDFRTFAITQEQLKSRSRNNYRGVKKYENVYSGFLVCGDCKAPMFSMSRPDLAPAYTCGTYHQRGTKGCSSHHTRIDILDKLLKSYVERVKINSAEMIERLNQSIKDEQSNIKDSADTLEILQSHIEDAKAEMKMLARQKTKELIRNPEKEDIIDETYNEMLDELANRIEGLQNQIELTSNRKNTIIRINRIAKTALQIFDEVIAKEKLSKPDIELIIDKIIVYENHIEIKLKSDIDQLLKCGTITENIPLQATGTDGGASINFNSGTENISTITQSARNRADKVFSVNVISSGEPLEIYTSTSGEVIFKKYSPLSDLSPFAAQYADVLFKNSGVPCMISDRDHIIAVSGLSKREYIDRRITAPVEKIMNSRKIYNKLTDKNTNLSPCEGASVSANVAAPIVSGGDVMGTVMLIDSEKHSYKDSDMQMASVAAAFLGRQMED